VVGAIAGARKVGPRALHMHISKAQLRNVRLEVQGAVRVLGVSRAAGKPFRGVQTVSRGASSSVLDPPSAIKTRPDEEQLSSINARCGRPPYGRRRSLKAWWSVTWLLISACRGRCQSGQRTAVRISRGCAGSRLPARGQRMHLSPRPFERPVTRYLADSSASCANRVDATASVASPRPRRRN